MKKRNIKLLYITWILITIIIIIVTIQYTQTSDLFLGIAESREVEINFGQPVEIKKLYVFPGKRVQKGDLLVELQRTDLTMDINRIAHNLDKFHSQGTMKRSEIISRLNQLKAEKAAKVNEIRYTIKELQNQYDTNIAIMKDLKSLDSSDQQPKQQNPLLLQIKSKKQELAFYVKKMNIHIEYLRKELKQPQNAQQIQAERLQKELNLLKEEEVKLKIRAQISGIIGSVNYKENEKISAFTPILTIHPTQPHYIKGYLHENAANTIKVGDSIAAFSYVDKNKKTIGEVIGIGARIVEFPERLRKMPELKLWGREVLVSVPKNNSFLLGEKIILSPKTFDDTITHATHLFAKSIEKKQTLTSKDVHDINPVPSLKIHNNIEASGVLYLADIDKYLVISDDTPKKRPYLYLMNKNGQIEKQVIIENLGKISDMEAITSDNMGNIYIAASQSYSKKGNHPATRTLLIKVKRFKDNFLLAGKINLYNELIKNAKQDGGEKWANFILNGHHDRSIDIEGCAYYNGDLLLGFKAPKLDNNRNIALLRLHNINNIFTNKTIEANHIDLWNSFKLGEVVDNKKVQKKTWLTDLCYDNNMLYLVTKTTTKMKGKKIRYSGSVWRHNVLTGHTKKITTFDQLTPEGITLNNQKNELLIVFDNGGKHKSQWYRGQL